VPDSTEQQLNSLLTLSKIELAGLWQQLFKVAPNPKIRKPLMLRVLAIRIQEQAWRSISAAAESRLQRLAASVASNPTSKVSSIPRIRAGTRLVREWRDQVHLVNVQEAGYEYRGERYKSLSQIARLITGTRWSGPLFFGIKQKTLNSRSQEVQ
jgi:hypothetical protein